MNNELSNNRRSKFDIRNSTFGIFPGILASVLSGLLLFAVFPPLEWSALAWVALVPLLDLQGPRQLLVRDDAALGQQVAQPRAMLDC